MTVDYHELEVEAVEALTDSAVAVTLGVPGTLRPRFTHVPGQHVVVKADIDGETVRRSYSICSPAGAANLTIGIKKLPGGAFSTYANERLRPGDVLEVTPPTGEFTLAPDPDHTGHYVAIVAGSGITPVLSMIASVLPVETASRFTLIYGNRDGGSVMFLDELDTLKNRYPDRFSIFHVLSREPQAIPLLEGRIDEDKLTRMFRTVVDAATATGWYLCGPAGVVEAARAVLAAGGFPDEDVHFERFYAGGAAASTTAPDDVSGSVVRFTLHGRTSTVVVDPARAPILDHALAARPETPFSCRSGACASCRAQVTSGEVVMDRNWALNEQEVAAGQILTCQAHPVSPVVEITYDL